MSSKRKPPTKVVQPQVKQSAKLPLKASINESKASISAASPAPIIPASSIQTIEISSDSSSSYGDLSDDDNDEDALSGEEDLAAGAAGSTAGKLGQKGSASQSRQPAGVSRMKAKQQHDSRDEDTDMLSPPPQARNVEDGNGGGGGGGGASDDEEEPTSPTFGDLIRSHEAVDVNAASPGAQQEPTPNSLLAQPHPRTIAPPSLASLGTVLNQALRTDDTDLLESCLNTTDLITVRNTIQRMDSALAGTLLSKLAARMHRRPGRAHSLMSWVQWTLVAHGGALATQPELMKRLTELNRVLDERARGLGSLLMLKGKLDMLEAQMQLRRGNKARRPGADRDGDDDSEDGLDDEEGIVYVEGEEERTQPNGIASRNRPAAEDGADELLVNGADGSDDDSSSDDDDDEDLDMDEPDVSEGESLDEDEVDHDDVEESADEDDSDVEAAAPPAKVQKTSKAFPKRR